jgi:hypothetical protein
MAFFRNMGIFLGTMIGGLADPAEQYKSVFGGVKFFLDHPYAFPTLISGVFAASAAVLCLFFVKEVGYCTQHVHRRIAPLTIIDLGS